MAKSGVAFLMYHELETPGRTLCQTEPGYVRYIVRSTDFRAQMEQLNNQNFKAVSVGEAVRSFADGTVAITFDDGCETDLLVAAPILREFGFGATFYITTGWSGQPGYLNHSQIRELSSQSFEIGCHSMHHLDLTDLGEEGLRREIAEAKLQLEQVIGKSVEHFSCPGGRHNAAVAQNARRAGYRTVSTSRIRSNSPSSDPFALGRVAVLRTTSLDEFTDLCSGRGLRQKDLVVQARAAAKKLVGNSTYDRLREKFLRRRSDP
jgi:peptidoglycan/xylan/chitin deacetylase (PgdA/CDA1 family)